VAVDMFMKLEGIDGESQDSVHAKEIDVLAWSWGMSNSGTAQAGGGAGAGKVNVQDLSFTKWVDLASTPLMLAVANGKHITKATLVVRKAGESPLEYITIEMTECLQRGGLQIIRDREPLSLEEREVVRGSVEMPEYQLGHVSERHIEQAANRTSEPLSKMLCAFSNEFRERHDRHYCGEEYPYRAGMDRVFQYQRYWNEQEQQLEDHLPYVEGGCRRFIG